MFIEVIFVSYITRFKIQAFKYNVKNNKKNL